MNATPTFLPRESIERIAERFAEMVGYAPGQDIAQVVNKLGGEVGVQESEGDGEICVEEGGKFKICVSPYTSRSRDRFTVAHELGHYVLHAKMGKQPLSIARSGLNEVEREANLFAAALLMPAEEFKRMAATERSDAALANHFDVSTDAVRVRKRVLGISS